MSMQTGRRVGVAFVGMGGAVATTAIAGIEMIKSGSNRLDGLPLAGVPVAGALSPQRTQELYETVVAAGVDGAGGVGTAGNEALHDLFTRTRAIRRGIVAMGQETAEPDFGRARPAADEKA